MAELRRHELSLHSCNLHASQFRKDPDCQPRKRAFAPLSSNGQTGVVGARIDEIAAGVHRSSFITIASTKRLGYAALYNALPLNMCKNPLVHDDLPTSSRSYVFMASRKVCVLSSNIILKYRMSIICTRKAKRAWRYWEIWDSIRWNKNKKTKNLSNDSQACIGRNTKSVVLIQAAVQCEYQGQNAPQWNYEVAVLM